MQVKLIKNSIANGIRICTFILEYNRYIHSELLTHRVLSKNSSSSRAIPTSAIIQNIRDNPAEAVWWGKNMSGMQAKEALSGWRLKLAKLVWASARECAILGARLFNRIGLHKQLANRILEPFQNIRVVVTATEWSNFFNLRDSPDAQPEFAALARMMKLAMEASTPTVLQPGEWHIPYVTCHRMLNGRIAYLQPEIAQTECVEITLEEALMISASMAAQESYRKSDPSLEKAKKIYAQLIGGAVSHSSPFEHSAMAMEQTVWVPSPKGLNGQGYKYMIETKGITHMDRAGNYWSGNLRGYIQYRQLIPNHDVKG